MTIELEKFEWRGAQYSLEREEEAGLIIFRIHKLATDSRGKPCWRQALFLRMHTDKHADNQGGEDAAVAVIEYLLSLVKAGGKP